MKIANHQNDRINIAYWEYKNNPTEEKLSELLHISTPLVKHFAYCLGGGVTFNDAVQAGYEGVLKAAKRFNPEYDASFATYAGHWISGEIRHYIRKEMKYYKPNFINDLQIKAQDYIDTYYAKEAKLPSKHEISEVLNIKEDGVDEVLRAGLVSIDQINLDKLTCVRYENFKLPIEDKIVLFEAIRKLSRIKQTIIFSLFFKNKTQQQTADFLDMNQRKVSRLLKSSLSDLREYLGEELIG
ncbi:MAG: sigma-70 family RNA polymerase sigma factor [Clostridiaceae bacterium]|nr:sigma-70 family RNA polymerase sigma factor [Clostridiaceae bacterium]